MKIAFFSKDGNCGVTSNMSAISIVGVLEFQMRIVTLENHYNRDGIAHYLLYDQRYSLLQEKTVEYLGHGMDESLVMHYANCTKKRRTDILTIEVIQNSLYYMPQNVYSKDIFDYEFTLNVIPRLGFLEKAYEYIFIDTRNYTMNSRILLDEANLVVVNLNQDYDDIKAFFSSYSSLTYKSLFLISNYRPHNSWNITKIANEFHIAKERIIGIRYNQQFENAVYHGKMINFIYDHFQCSCENPNYPFIQCIKKAAQRLIAGAEENRKADKECITIHEEQI